MNMTEDTVRAVREKMDLAGCVFDFTVHTMAEGVVVTEAQHRAVLAALFGQIQTQLRDLRTQMLAKNPDLAGKPYWQLNYQVECAIATAVDAMCVVGATALQPGYREGYAPGHTWFEALAQSFDDPPYRAQCPPNLFVEFCSVLGLLPAQDIAILDWVGGPDAHPECSAWSNYFDAGKEWWGIWCMTVWNPQQRTLSAFAASATD
jgi:hypothetical protein